MAQFDNCIDFVLSNEGGVLKDAATGEFSNHGVTEKLLKDINWYPKDPSQLDLNACKNVYYINFWQRWNLQSITSDKVARKVFDMIVNMGPRQAALNVQRALDFTTAATDGVLGFWTISDLNQWSESNALDRIVAQCVDFYTKLADSDVKYAKYKDGWLVRARKI